MTSRPGRPSPVQSRGVWWLCPSWHGDDPTRRSPHRRMASWLRAGWQRGRSGMEQTVLIDWAFLDTGPLGAELASPVCVGLLFGIGEWTQARELDETEFAGYLEGLRDAGWEGDPRTVRLGYSACAGSAPSATWGSISLRCWATRGRASGMSGSYATCPTSLTTWPESAVSSRNSRTRHGNSWPPEPPCPWTYQMDHRRSGLSSGVGTRVSAAYRRSRTRRCPNPLARWSGHASPRAPS